MGTRSKSVAVFAVLALAVLAVYSNHFHNTFQFDDAHTVVQNPYIRDLDHVGALFTDVRTTTPNPENQIYRPLVTLSLAVDYHLGHGLRPFWFHLDTFLFYLVQLAVMFALFRRILRHARGGVADAADDWIAWFAVAFYAVHPVMAETVNYVYQRGDLYSTLGVVATIVVYAGYPALRKYGVYLLPALVGMLAKQSALMVAPLLLFYILLFESESDDVLAHANVVTAIKRSIPIFVLAAAYYLFQRTMTSPTWTSGGSSRLHYWYTQPLVILHYVIQCVLPTQLSADTDRGLVTHLLSEEVVIGVSALVVMAVIIWRSLRVRERRPIAYGLLWFLISLVPTSVLPFAEVENDHRMFLPLVGLVLAMTWAVALWLRGVMARRANGAALRRALPVAAVVLLLGYGIGAHRRNEVWHTEASLWKDVTEKSPRNGRGLMNYGLALMGRGDYVTALAYFERAQPLTPNYWPLLVNLGIANSALGNLAAAESSFQRAVAIAPNRAEPYHFYARWLAKQQRTAAAVKLWTTAVSLNPDYLDAIYGLLQAQRDLGNLDAVLRLATATATRFPSDGELQRFLTLAKGRSHGQTPLALAEDAVRVQPTADSLLELSLQYALVGKHRESIKAAQLALQLNPSSAEAYNNLSSGHAQLGEWAEAVQAAEAALQLRPDFELARNNLRFAQQHLAAPVLATPGRGSSAP